MRPNRACWTCVVLAALAWVVLLAPHATGAVLPLQSRGPLRLADLGRARSAHTLPLRRNTNVTQGNNHTNHTYETTSSPFSTSTTSTSSTPTPAPTTNSSNASTDDVGSSPVGAATPAPPTGSGGAAVATESFFLQLAVVLPYTKAEFDAEKQQAYRTALAIASKTDVDKVEIVSITDSRRRAGRITVVTRITADDAAAVTALQNTLGTGDALKAKINKELVAQGLSEALDVSRPTVGGEANEEDCGGGNMKDGFSGFWARLKACPGDFFNPGGPFFVHTLGTLAGFLVLCCWSAFAGLFLRRRRNRGPPPPDPNPRWGPRAPSSIVLATKQGSQDVECGTGGPAAVSATRDLWPSSGGLRMATDAGEAEKETDEVRVLLTLDMEMQAIAGFCMDLRTNSAEHAFLQPADMLRSTPPRADEYDDDTEGFKDMIAADIAAAVGGDVTKIRILSLEPGSILVLAALDDGVCEGVKVMDVANNLRQQAEEAASALRMGAVTKNCLSATVSVVKVKAPKDSLLWEVAAEDRLKETSCGRKALKLQSEKRNAEPPPSESSVPSLLPAMVEPKAAESKKDGQVNAECPTSALPALTLVDEALALVEEAQQAVIATESNGCRPQDEEDHEGNAKAKAALEEVLHAAERKFREAAEATAAAASASAPASGAKQVSNMKARASSETPALIPQAHAEGAAYVSGIDSTLSAEREIPRLKNGDGIVGDARHRQHMIEQDQPVINTDRTETRLQTGDMTTPDVILSQNGGEDAGKEGDADRHSAGDSGDDVSRLQDANARVEVERGKTASLLEKSFSGDWSGIDLAQSPLSGQVRMPEFKNPFVENPFAGDGLKMEMPPVAIPAFPSAVPDFALDPGKAAVDAAANISGMFSWMGAAVLQNTGQNEQAWQPAGGICGPAPTESPQTSSGVAGQKVPSLVHRDLPLPEAGTFDRRLDKPDRKPPARQSKNVRSSGFREPSVDTPKRTPTSSADAGVEAGQRPPTLIPVTLPRTVTENGIDAGPPSIAHVAEEAAIPPSDNDARRVVRQIEAFYARHAPDRVSRASETASLFGVGGPSQDIARLNRALRQKYGASLDDMPAVDTSLAQERV